MVQRYSAEEGRTPLISRLGGTAWQKTKAKARKAIREMAEELLKNDAARKARGGRAFAPDTPWQQYGAYRVRASTLARWPVDPTRRGRRLLSPVGVA
jgi:transcription-repair coupling factor (superfamily II helicase)